MVRSPRDVLNAFIRQCDSELCPNVPSPPAQQPEKSAQLCPNVPDCAQSEPPPENCKTNPPRPTPAPVIRGHGRESVGSPSKSLSLRQQHAARLLVLGLGSKRAARQLGLNHHTIARWKRDPRFAALIDKYNRALEAGTADMAKTMT